jgi:predicted ribosomally synthesized peptide with nif11-like leader
MSSPELSRLLEDLRKDPLLLNESRALLRDSEAALCWARDHGYRLSPADVAELLDSDRELSDDDLDQAAGGDDAWPPA